MQVERLEAAKEELEADVVQLRKSAVSSNANDYVDNLRRQIKSLKDYTKAMEKRRKSDEKEASSNLKRRDDAILFMQKEMLSLKQKLASYGDPSVTNDDIDNGTLPIKDAGDDVPPQAAKRKSSIKNLWNKISTPLGAKGKIRNRGGIAVAKPPDMDGSPRADREGTDEEANQNPVENGISEAVGGDNVEEAEQEDSHKAKILAV